MDAAKNILHDKQPDLKDQVQRRWTKLTDEDRARLNDKREELIMILRQWHHYSRKQADRVISDWLYCHGQARSYRTGPASVQAQIQAVHAAQRLTSATIDRGE